MHRSLQLHRIYQTKNWNDHIHVSLKTTFRVICHYSNNPYIEMYVRPVIEKEIYVETHLNKWVEAMINDWNVT